nr:DUF6049 family protein [Agromyces protaetiae]
MRGAGYTTTILDAANVEPINGQPNAAAAVEGESAIVADATLSAALQAAAAATSDAEWGEASGRLSAELALRAAAGETSTLVATFARDAGVQPARVGATLAELEHWPWSPPANLAGAIGAPPTDRTLVDGHQGDGRLGGIRRLFESETSLTSFASVLDDPDVLTAPARRSLLALLDVAWIEDPAGWSTAVGEQLTEWNDARNAISVAPSSQVNVLSAGANFPTTVENKLPYPVNVVVHASPSNGRLVIEEDVTVTVPAESRTNVLVPVKAGVSNGNVVLTVTLSSPTGVPLGQPVQIPANVQADWEGVGATILAVVLVLFFGIGIWRNIRRRRRERAEAAAQGADGASSDVSSDTDVSTAPVGSEASEAPETSESPEGRND